MLMERLVIKKYKLLQLLMVVVAVCIFLSITTWALLDNSHWSYIKSQLRLGQESKQLWEINRILEADNKKLHERVIKLEQMAQVDNQSAANVQEEMKKLQDEVYRLKGELEFYQGVMDSARETKGLTVQGLHIEALQKDQGYRFKLILTHVTISDKVAEGRIDISVGGIRGGSPEVLNIKDVILEQSLDLTYKFKHFKRLEGNMVLPEGFVPHRVTVKLHPKDKKLSMIKRVYVWPATTL